MAQRSHVPKFGQWDGGEDVPYTAYFDKARKGRTGGKIINPNDPQENPDIVNYVAPAQAAPRARTEPAEPPAQATRRSQEHRRSREDIDYRHSANSPSRHDNSNRGVGDESAQQRNGGRGATDTSRRSSRQSAGSENSFERSPHHPHARISGKSSGAPSPGPEGKNLYESGHATPGRSRLGPRGNESPDKGAAVPKFGDWDENNPASADGYTHIFAQVRDERLGRPAGSSYTDTPREPSDGGSKCFCFGWGK